MSDDLVRIRGTLRADGDGVVVRSAGASWPVAASCQGLFDEAHVVSLLLGGPVRFEAEVTLAARVLRGEVTGIEAMLACNPFWVSVTGSWRTRGRQRATSQLQSGHAVQEGIDVRLVVEGQRVRHAFWDDVLPMFVHDELPRCTVHLGPAREGRPALLWAELSDVCDAVFVDDDEADPVALMEHLARWLDAGDPDAI